MPDSSNNPLTDALSDAEQLEVLLAAATGYEEAIRLTVEDLQRGRIPRIFADRVQVDLSDDFELPSLLRHFYDSNIDFVCALLQGFDVIRANPEAMDLETLDYCRTKCSEFLEHAFSVIADRLR